MVIYTQATNIGFNPLVASCIQFIQAELWFCVSEVLIVTLGSISAGIFLLESTFQGNFAIVPSPLTVLRFALRGDLTNQIHFG